RFDDARRSGATRSEWRTRFEDARKGLEEAQQIVKEMGLRLLDVKQRTSVEMLPNTVLEQAPGAGEEVVEGERVRVVVSKLE
ncbi:MAG: PASTA domain-containing protein, partial [Candidatus Latescibacteria bacterium]|nr:PASTA domain-containing protein [Candidatus Latescibacterota bacterium]